MTKKNAWNKVYEETERTYKAKDENGKWKKVTETVQSLARPGMKPSKKEQEFSQTIRKMKADKPKAFNGDWTK